MATLTTSHTSHERDEERKLLSETRVPKTEVRSPREVYSDLTDESMKSDGNLILEEVLKPSRTRQVLVMIACLFLHIGWFGMFVTLGILYVELIAYFDAQRSEAALMQSMYAGCSLCGGLLFTKLVTKYDTGLLIAGASFVAAISFCASAFAPNIQVVIVLIGVIPGLLFSINFLAAFVVVSWMFQKNRKVALAVLTLGSAVGQIVFPYVARSLIDSYMWTGTVIVLGPLLYLNCIPCGILIHYSKPFFQKGDTAKIKQSKLLDPTCFQDVAFMLFLSMCLTFQATGWVEQWFIVDMSVLKGFSADAGATLLSINGIFGFSGRCIGSLILRLLPNTQQELYIACTLFTWAISHIIVSQSPVYWGMILGIVVRGLSVGTVAAFLPGLQIDIRGLEKYPQTVSISNFLNGIGSIFGGFLGGLSFDLTKSYDLIFFIAAGVNTFNAISVLIMFLIFRHRRKKNEYQTI